MNHVTHPMSSADISFFHQKSATYKKLLEKQKKLLQEIQI